MKKVVLFILTLVILLLPGCKNKENDNTLYYPIHIQIEILDKLNEIESSVSNVTTSEEVEKLINEMECEIKKLYTPLY